jgi:multidrug transporter EmrE-like cation transporter
VAFLLCLRSSDVSLAGPVANGLTFVFTALTAFVLHERQTSPARAILGSSLVVTGILTCTLAKT